MLLNMSMDGAQLYRDKESDAWFGISSLLDFSPEIQHSKEMVIPLFVIGRPNPPSIITLFSSQHSLISHLARGKDYASGTL
jgi:hypothetical protein